MFLSRKEFHLNKTIFAVLLLLAISLTCFTTSLYANTAPTIGTLTQSATTTNPGDTVQLTATYTDVDGYTNIRYAYILINTATSGTYCPYAYLDRNTNKLYLRDDVNTAWLGGYPPGGGLAKRTGSQKNGVRP